TVALDDPERQRHLLVLDTQEKRGVARAKEAAFGAQLGDTHLRFLQRRHQARSVIPVRKTDDQLRHLPPPGCGSPTRIIAAGPRTTQRPSAAGSRSPRAGRTAVRANRGTALPPGAPRG